MPDSNENDVGSGLEDANRSAGETATWVARGFLGLLTFLLVGGTALGVWSGHLDESPIVEGFNQTAWAWQYLFASMILGIGGLIIIALVLAPPDGFWPGFSTAVKRIIHQSHFEEFEDVEERMKEEE